MDKLQYLADTIAETYLAELTKQNGSNTITLNGKQGRVTPDLLSAGLFDNAVSCVKNEGEEFNVAGKAFDLLTPLINLSTKPYRLTAHGAHVIEQMNILALKNGDIRNQVTHH